MEKSQMEWRFFQLKRMVKEIASSCGRFFDTGRYAYKDFIEESRQKLIEMDVPDYDEKNPDLLTLYFVLAKSLYLIYDLFSLKNSRYGQERDALAARVKVSLEKMPCRNKALYSNCLADHFGIWGGEEQDGETPCCWLRHEDAWLDQRLFSFRSFIDTGKVPETDLSIFLWLYMKSYGHRLPASFENFDIVSDKSLDSLAAYCAYARDEAKLFENLNNYSLNLFTCIKRRGLAFENGLRKVTDHVYSPIDKFLKKNDLESIEKCRKEAEESGLDVETYLKSYEGCFSDELNREKSNLLTTIENNEEFIDLLMYHCFVKATENCDSILFSSFRTLVNKVFDCENVDQETLLFSMQNVLSQNIETLKKRPCLIMFCYLAIHYLEEEEWLFLFKKAVGDVKGASNNELVFKDVRECPELQLVFFFALFDMSRIPDKQDDFKIGDEFLASFKRGDWFEPSVQRRLFMGVLKQNGMECSISDDEMIFEKYVDKRFFATQSILNLVYNVSCYSESKSILNITQQINNLGEHRSDMVYHNVKASFGENQRGEMNHNGRKKNELKKEFYTDYTSDEQKKMKAEAQKMKDFDEGFLIPSFTQRIPACSNQFFSRNIEVKIFLQTDVSCVPGPEGLLQKRDYHLKRNQRMLECCYLYYARHMKIHNDKLSYTDSLLESSNYPDLLRILYSLMRQMQKDCMPDSPKNERLFEYDCSSCGSLDFDLRKFFLRNIDSCIEKGPETRVLDCLKYCESCVEKNSLDKDSRKDDVELFLYFENLYEKVKGKFSPNVDTAAAKVRESAKAKIMAMQESYDAVSYDLFKEESDYGSPFLKQCISLLLQVIQCVTSTSGVVDELKKPSEFNKCGEQRPLLNQYGDVTFEGLKNKVQYSDSLKKELRIFLDTVFGMENLRQSKNDHINRDVFHLYGHKIMLYLMKVTLQMTRLNLDELYKSAVAS